MFNQIEVLLIMENNMLVYIVAVQKGVKKNGENFNYENKLSYRSNFDCRFCVLFYVILIVEKLVEIAIFNVLFLLQQSY